MADGWDALGAALLYVGWPGLVLVSTFAIQRAVRFHRAMRNSAPGLLVLLTVIGWVLTLAGVALVSTVYLRQSPDQAGPLVLPVFVLWAGALVTVVWVVQRWGQEAETLDAYYGELERMEAMKRGFINHVAHELNTPMTPIRMELRALRNEKTGPLTEKQTRALDRLERNLERLAGLVEQVMLASHLQAGRVSLDLEDLDAQEVIRAAVEALPASRRASVRIEPAEVRLQADRSRLGYAVQAILMQATERAEGEVTVRLESRGGQAHVVFEFQGPPLASKDLQSFGDPEGLQERDDIGVALYNADGLLRLHSGGFEATPQGAAIRLPLRQ